MNKKVINKIIRITKAVILSLIIGVYGIQFYLAYQSTQVTGLPKIMGWGEVIFLSGSMSPEITTGSLALVHEQEDYQEREIVTYIKNNTLITHRIVKIQEDGKYVVQGDANNTPDEPITKDMIEGKVIISIPHIGTLLNQMKTPLGIASIAGVAVLIALWPQKEEEEQEDEERN